MFFYLLEALSQHVLGLILTCYNSVLLWCHSTPVAGSATLMAGTLALLAGSSFSWPVCHWCIPQLCFVWCHSTPVAGSATLMAGTLALLAGRWPAAAPHGRYATGAFPSFVLVRFSSKFLRTPCKQSL
ncbi:hypothetical protein CsSME_00053148 [Camellia sinensis var. sinensis]